MARFLGEGRHVKKRKEWNGGAPERRSRDRHLKEQPGKEIFRSFILYMMDDRHVKSIAGCDYIWLTYGV